MKLKIKMFFIKIIQKLIVKYLLKCGGFFHYNMYGDFGVYIAIMSDSKYYVYKKFQ